MGKLHPLWISVGLLLMGVLSALSLAPYAQWFWLLLTVPALYYAVQSATSTRRAAWYGYCWHYGCYLLGLHWIANALHVDSARFGWLVPITIVGIPLVMALFGTLHAAVFHAFFRHGKPIGMMAQFALLWVLTDWLRGWLFTGFPWNYLGYAANLSDRAIQVAAVGKVYLLTLLVVWVPLLGAAAWLQRQRSAAVLAALLLAGWFGFGEWRLQHAPTEDRAFRIRVVQPNIPQSLKWSAEQRESILALTRGTSDSQPPQDVDLVIWPETAIPQAITLETDTTAIVQQSVPLDGHLLSGAIRLDHFGDAMPPKWHNSAVIFQPAGQVIQEYHKEHLVPFGEYLPFRGILPMEKITAGSEDFSEGSAEQPLNQSGFLPPWRTLICYEAIFPDEVNKDTDAQKAAFLVNITNDAWYGNSAGPYQHLEQSRLRAVEQGIPLFRSANTGISAVYDAYGRLRSSLPFGVRGMLDSRLPSAARHHHLYQAINSGFIPFLIVLVVVFALMNRINIRK